MPFNGQRPPTAAFVWFIKEFLALPLRQQHPAQARARRVSARAYWRPTLLPANAVRNRFFHNLLHQSLEHGAGAYFGEMGDAVPVHI